MTISRNEYDRAFRDLKRAAELRKAEEGTQHKQAVNDLRNPGNAKSQRAENAKARKLELEQHARESRSSWPFRDLPRNARVSFTSGRLPTLGKRH